MLGFFTSATTITTHRPVIGTIFSFVINSKGSLCAYRTQFSIFHDVFSVVTFPKAPVTGFFYSNQINIINVTDKGKTTWQKL